MSWIDPQLTRTAACALTCVGMAISSLEWLTPVGKLGPAGLLSVSASRVGASPRAGAWRSRGLYLVMTLRLACALGYVASLVLPTGEIGLLALGAGLLCLPLRLPGPVGVFAGMNGAEHVMTATLLALGPTYLLNSELALQAALGFVAFRALAEYVSAGASKLADWRNWANGLNLRRVAASDHYGHPGLASLLDAHPALGGVLSFAVIAVELAVVLALVLPFPWGEALLLAALAFHLGTGVVMGLNTFAWAFLGTYPVILHFRDLLAQST